MRIHLSGQGAFGAAVLDMLLDRGDKVVSITTPAGALRDRAEEAFGGDCELDYGSHIVAPGRIHACLTPGTDLIVCAHSHEFIGAAARSATRLGAIGYHPSLLPLHRGRDAIRWALKMRERVTGGSVYWLTDVADAGPIAAQDFCFVRPDDDARSLWRRDLFPMGLRPLAQVLDDLEVGRIVARPQDEALATWEPALERRRFKPDEAATA